MSAHTHADPSGADADAIALAVEVFAMLADPTRVRIVLALSDGELPVGELADTVGKAQTAVSQHLAKLRMARMVATRQDGNRVYYRLTDEHARSLVDNALQQAEHAVEARPAHHEARP